MKEEEKVEGKKEPKKSNKKVIFIVISILFIIIIGGTLLFKDKLFKKDVEKKEVENKINEVASNYKMSGNGLEDIDLKFLQLETNNKNIVYSPLSIKYALGMLNEGTAGNSKAQISSIIGDYKARKYLNSNNMSFANAMFIRDSYKSNIKSSYIKNLKDKYNAEVVYDDFKSPDNINKWASDNTFNLVNNVVKDVSESDYFLLNALAIDMEWNKRLQATVDTYQDKYVVEYKHEDYSEYIGLKGEEHDYAIRFNNKKVVQASEIGASINKYDIVEDKGKENIRKFITEEYQKWLDTNDCGNDYNEPVDEFVEKYIEELDSNYQSIEASTDFRFFVDDDIKVFAKELKKYNGMTLEYIGIMPTKENLNEFIKNTNAEKINKIINSLKEMKLESFEDGKITKITGGIPLFKYEYQLDLIKDLKNIGVNDVFDSQKADLSGLTKEKSFITQASHKANIEFSNEGITAAAATTEGGAGATGCWFDYLYEVPVVTIDLTFDKPFLYLIRDKDTGEIWFVGSVFNPSENTEEFVQIINE